jgi:hypothetical protein
VLAGALAELGAELPSNGDDHVGATALSLTPPVRLGSAETMPSTLSPTLRRLVAGAIVAAGALVVLAVVAARQAPVLARGELLPWFEDYTHVARVRLAGVELYVDTSSGLADLMTVLALAAVALVFATGAVCARRDPALRRTFAIAALGAAVPQRRRPARRARDRRAQPRLPREPSADRPPRRRGDGASTASSPPASPGAGGRCCAGPCAGGG